MRNIISLFLAGMSYITNSFSNTSAPYTSYSYKLPYSKDLASLSKDWTNIGNSIKRGISKYEASEECTSEQKK